ncbi:pentapeptide repeat-containing protein [Nocardia nepalensis]|uniref:pentapeptide repeat-containing protein n=1 Tax=Nocardia nepalensis TaxID=3375448 RepID=UPI003B67284D
MSNPATEDVRVAARRALIDRFPVSLGEDDRQPLRGFTRSQWKPITAWGVAVALVSGFVVWVIWFAPGQLTSPLNADDLAAMHPDQRVAAQINYAAARNQVRTTLIGAIAGAAFLTTGFFAWRQIVVSRLGQLTDRFTKSVENLGAAQSAVRLGGVYALEQLGEDRRFTRPVAHVLVAFVRQSSESPTPATAGRSESPRLIVGNSPSETGVENPAIVPYEVQDAMMILASKGLWRRGVDAPIALAGVTLPGINLPRADLRQAVLYHADLRSADFRDADLFEADLRGARLTDAYLLAAKLGDTWFQRADLSGAHLESVEGGDTKFKEADLHGAYLTYANLPRADFEQANLHGVYAESATLTDARFVEANLADSRFPAANLTDADFSSANLRGAILENARLTGATLAYANLADTRLGGAVLVSANLTGANLPDTNLVGADLTGANLATANLTTANLTDAELTDANLSGANLCGATMTDADLTSANLTGVRSDERTRWPDGFVPDSGAD